MDRDLRVALWNRVYQEFLAVGPSRQAGLQEFCNRLCERLRIDTHNLHHTTAITQFREVMLTEEWWRPYFLVEQVLALLPEVKAHYSVRNFPGECERILEEENAGYRIREGKFIPITNATELAEIDTALAATGTRGLESVQERLRGALEALARKPTANCAHAVTEAIGAAESLAKIATKQPAATFGRVLTELAKTTSMPPHLQDALKSYWLWTCNDGGRHGTTTPLDVDGAEARFAIITCSALINFVIAKLPNDSGRPWPTPGEEKP